MINKVIVFTIVLFVSFTSLYAQPKIKILPSTALDLGDLYKGQKGERTVIVKNIGTDTLRLTQVKASCGCTAARGKENALGPSDSTELSISFNTENQQPGKVTKQVFVTSNDTSNPKVTVQFVANVVEILSMTPPYISFDHTVVDSMYVKTITLKNPSKEHGIKILSVETKFEYLKVALMKNVLMPGEETQLQATFKTPKAGTSNGSIILTTDNPMQKQFEIKVYCWVNRK